MSVDRDPAQLHVPVLLNECLDMLAPAIEAPGAVLIDATLGMGGHTEAALTRFPQLTVFGIDRDPSAIALASKRLEAFGPRFRAFHTTYDKMDEVAAHAPSGMVDGILMDLGVSSLQLDQEERGFSYSHDAPLDMRMNPQTGISAAQLLASASKEEITRILRVYGEEKFASKIAGRIVATRDKEPLTHTSQLAQIVRDCIPAPARRTGGNPAKRTFQALRIAVNDELTILEAALPAALAHLRVGGRIVIESYQSLEDRLVKDIFRRGATDQAPAGVPMIPEELQARLRLLTRGAQLADDTEKSHNPRSASVRLRGAQMIRPWKERP